MRIFLPMAIACSLVSMDRDKKALDLISNLRLVIDTASGGRNRQEILLKHWRSVFGQELDALNMAFEQDSPNCITISYPEGSDGASRCKHKIGYKVN